MRFKERFHVLGFSEVHILNLLFSYMWIPVDFVTYKGLDMTFSMLGLKKKNILSFTLVLILNPSNWLSQTILRMINLKYICP